MNPEIKAKWVAALRSGKYQQGSHQLKNDDLGTHCCLGVLCELHAEETKDEWSVDEEYKDPRYNGKTDVLPAVVMEWAGLEENNPYLNDQTAAYKNDRGVPFETLATLIEENL